MSKAWISQKAGRLDALLVESCPELSRTALQKLIKGRSVLVNDDVISKPAFQIEEGDEITLLQREPDRKDSSLEPVDLGLSILYEDDACIVISKPAGYAVHPAPSIPHSEPTILSGIAHLFQERSLPFSGESVLVHRLDRETTGCLLIAKNQQAHAALQKQFEDRTVKKTYLAVVLGIPENKKALIDAPIGRNLTDRTRMSVLKTSKSREAQTSYEVLDATNETALLACDLHTGRTHQIRVHLASIGHPILGDPSYGTPASTSYSENHSVNDLCLHAWKLSFVSPADAKKKDIVAEPTEVFLRTLEDLHLAV